MGLGGGSDGRRGQSTERIKFLAGIIKHVSLATPHLTGMKTASLKVTPMPGFFVSLERAISRMVEAKDMVAPTPSATEHSSELAHCCNHRRQTADAVPCQARRARSAGTDLPDP
jgi:hypothetical protein